MSRLRVVAFAVAGALVAAGVAVAKTPYPPRAAGAGAETTAGNGTGAGVAFAPRYALATYDGSNYVVYLTRERLSCADTLLAKPPYLTVTVVGGSPLAVGTPTPKPTNAVFTFGVSNDGATAAGALAANGRQMTRVISALKSSGIAPGDIQTAEISVNANRTPSGNRILNYTASNSVTALVKQIANSGPVIDAAVAAGANQLSGPSLSSADQQTLSRRALQAAIADARARAGVIARAAGVPLGRVLTVSEVTSTPIPIEGAVSARAASTPVEAGTVQTEADVNVTFAIG